MPDKFLCLLATFDKETSKVMKEIEHVMNKYGIVGRQTPNAKVEGVSLYEFFPTRFITEYHLQ